MNGIFLPELRQTKTSDTKSERQRDNWTICRFCSTQCNSGLIRCRACFWPSFVLVCQSSILLSRYALELLISMDYRHIPIASIAELSMLSKEAKLGPALNRISGAKVQTFTRLNMPCLRRSASCAAASGRDSSRERTQHHNRISP